MLAKQRLGLAAVQPLGVGHYFSVALVGLSVWPAPHPTGRHRAWASGLPGRQLTARGVYVGPPVGPHSGVDPVALKHRRRRPPPPAASLGLGSQGSG